jgi:MFS family permease
MPSLPIALAVFVLVGVMSILFIALGNTTLQLASQPEMRGRVMSLWAIAFVGTTPIGGPIIGYISDRTNPRVGLAWLSVASQQSLPASWAFISISPL